MSIFDEVPTMPRQGPASILSLPEEFREKARELSICAKENDLSRDVVYEGVAWNAETVMMRAKSYGYSKGYEDGIQEGLERARQAFERALKLQGKDQ